MTLHTPKDWGVDYVMALWVCVCVWEREREIEGETAELCVLKLDRRCGCCWLPSDGWSILMERGGWVCTCHSLFHAHSHMHTHSHHTHRHTHTRVTCTSCSVADILLFSPLIGPLGVVRGLGGCLQGGNTYTQSHPRRRSHTNTAMHQENEETQRQRDGVIVTWRSGTFITLCTGNGIGSILLACAACSYPSRALVWILTVPISAFILFITYQYEQTTTLCTFRWKGHTRLL